MARGRRNRRGRVRRGRSSTASSRRRSTRRPRACSSTAPSAPYLRTPADHRRRRRGCGRSARRAAGPARCSSRRRPSTAAPDTKTLVNAANLYPLLIESDRIKTIREAQAGTIPGTRHGERAQLLDQHVRRLQAVARCPWSRSRRPRARPRTPRCWRPRRVTAFADLDPRTSSAARASRRQQRIIVQQLQTPALTTTGGPSWGLPLFVGALVFLGFCGLAVIADNARPSREPARASEPRRAPRRRPAWTSSRERHRGRRRPAGAGAARGDPGGELVLVGRRDRAARARRLGGADQELPAAGRAAVLARALPAAADRARRRLGGRDRHRLAQRVGRRARQADRRCSPRWA